jgi:DNA invertase Pin-like site-specific DNA recombinase
MAATIHPTSTTALGMKRTFAQAELHIIRARLHGGKLNKAQKGALRFLSPVGLGSNFVPESSSYVRCQ